MVSGKNFKEKITEKAFDFQLVTKRLLCEISVGCLQLCKTCFHPAAFRIQKQAGVSSVVKKRAKVGCFHTASWMIVEENRLYDDGEQADAASGDRDSAVRDSAVDKQPLSRCEDMTFVAYLISNMPLLDKNKFKVIVPVTGNGVSLKSPQLIVMDGHGKFRGAMNAEFFLIRIYLYGSFAHKNPFKDKWFVVYSL